MFWFRTFLHNISHKNRQRAQLYPLPDQTRPDQRLMLMLADMQTEMEPHLEMTEETVSYTGGHIDDILCGQKRLQEWKLMQEQAQEQVLLTDDSSLKTTMLPVVVTQLAGGGAPPAAETRGPQVNSPWTIELPSLKVERSTHLQTREHPAACGSVTSPSQGSADVYIKQVMPKLSNALRWATFSTGLDLEASQGISHGLVYANFNAPNVTFSNNEEQNELDLRRLQAYFPKLTSQAKFEISKFAEGVMNEKQQEADLIARAAPTMMPAAEAEKFQDWYLRALKNHQTRIHKFKEDWGHRLCKGSAGPPTKRRKTTQAYK